MTLCVCACAGYSHEVKGRKHTLAYIICCNCRSEGFQLHNAMEDSDHIPDDHPQKLHRKIIVLFFLSVVHISILSGGPRSP